MPALDVRIPKQLLELADLGCPDREGKGVATVSWEMEINVPDGMSHILQSPVNLSASAICRCTVLALLRTRAKEFDQPGVCQMPTRTLGPALIVTTPVCSAASSWL